MMSYFFDCDYNDHLLYLDYIFPDKKDTVNNIY